MANGSSGGGGMFGAVSDFISRVGFPVFVAVFLLTQATNIKEPVASIAKSLESLSRTQRIMAAKCR